MGVCEVASARLAEWKLGDCLRRDSDYTATMTTNELTAAIDAMITAAGNDADQLPGLISVNSNDWCGHLHEIERITRNLEEGIRHREIRVSVSSAFETKVLTRAEAGERGAPYRDLT